MRASRFHALARVAMVASLSALSKVRSSQIIDFCIDPVATAVSDHFAEASHPLHSSHYGGSFAPFRAFSASYRSQLAINIIIHLVCSRLRP